MTLRLASLGRDADADTPHRTAISCGRTRLSWSDLDARCDAVAVSLQGAGLVPGDRIALLLPGTPDFAVALLGASRAGLVVIPLNPLVGVTELGEILNAMRPRAIITLSQETPLPAIQALARLRSEFAPDARLYISGPPGPMDLQNGATGFADLHEPSVSPNRPAPSSRGPDDEAVILFTSGTTGAPKGVSLSEHALMTNALAVGDQLSITPLDIILSPLPPSHVFGLVVGLLSALAAGGAVVLVPRPTPEQVWEAIVETGPTLMLAVPATLAAVARIAASAPKTSTAPTLRTVTTGGAPLPPAVAAEFARLFSTRVVQGYGMTETAGLISLPAVDGEIDPASVGRVLPGYQHRLRSIGDSGQERGELQLRYGPLFRGLYIQGVFEPRNPEEWFSTGDLVDIDAKGRITIRDRLKELIIRGGYNVYPSEVEAALSAHPDVIHAAVVGVADPSLGEEVAAFVTLRPEAQATAEDLVTWSRAALATYKYPRRVVILEAMPLTPSGKILKRALPLDRLSTAGA